MKKGLFPKFGAFWMICFFGSSILTAQNSATKEDIQKVEQSITNLNKEFEKLSAKTVQFGLSLGYRFLTNKSKSNYDQASISPLDSTLQITPIGKGAYLLSTSAIFNPNLNTKELKKKIDKNILAYMKIKMDEGEDCTSYPLILGELAAKADVTIQHKDSINQDEYKSLVKAIENKSEVYISNAHIRAFIRKLSEKKENKKIARRLKFLMTVRGLTDYLFDRLVLGANINLVEFSAAQKDFSFNKSIEGGLGLSYKINEHLFVGINWEAFNSRQLYPYLKQQAGNKLSNKPNVIPAITTLDVNNDSFFRTANMEGFSLKLIASF